MVLFNFLRISERAMNARLFLPLKQLPHLKKQPWNKSLECTMKDENAYAPQQHFIISELKKYFMCCSYDEVRLFRYSAAVDAANNYGTRVWCVRYLQLDTLCL